MPREYGHKKGMGIAPPHPIPLVVLQRLADGAVESMEGFEVDGHASPCWLWQSYCDADGYAQVKWRGRKYRASRIQYTIFHGKMEHGTDIDHLCLNRACVNPAHLEQVDPVENRVIRRNKRMKREECPI